LVKGEYTGYDALNCPKTAGGTCPIIAGNLVLGLEIESAIMTLQLDDDRKTMLTRNGKARKVGMRRIGGTTIVLMASSGESYGKFERIIFPAWLRC
jgi:hypothetical protein